MKLLDFYKKNDISVSVAKIVFNHLFKTCPVSNISEICETTSGGTPNRSNASYYSGKIPWLKSGELNDGIIEKAEEFITEEGLKNSSAKLFPKGTLLVAMYGATAGKTGILNFDASTNQAVCAIFPNGKVHRDFLYWYFRQQRLDFINISKGGAQPNISQTVINAAKIPVPDKELQTIIVDFLKKCETSKTIDAPKELVEINDAIKRFFHIKSDSLKIESSYNKQEELIDKLRQSILQDAIQGKLVAQNPNGEPASELLKKIKSEKEKLIASGKVKKEKPLPPIKKDEIPFELPSSWTWCRLGEIIEYNPRNKADDSFDAGFIPMPLISSCFGETPTFQTTKWGKIKSGFTHFANNDVVVAKITPCFENSKAGIIKNLPNGIGAGTTELYVIRSFTDILLPEYIYIVLKTDDFLKEGERLMRGVAGQQRVPSDYVYNYLFPLPPTDVQKRIISKVWQLFEKIESFQKGIQHNQEKAKDLMQAVLQEAFN